MDTRRAHGRSLLPHLDDDDLDRFLTTIEVAMLGGRRIDIQPIRLPRLPRHLFQRLPLRIDYVQGSAFGTTIVRPWSCRWTDSG